MSSKFLTDTERGEPFHHGNNRGSLYPGVISPEEKNWIGNCNTCGSCEPRDDFYFCTAHDLGIYDPKNAGCGETYNPKESKIIRFKELS